MLTKVLLTDGLCCSSQSDPEFVQWKKELTEAFTEAQKLLRRAPKVIGKGRTNVVELSKPPLTHRNSNGLWAAPRPSLPSPPSSVYPLHQHTPSLDSLNVHRHKASQHAPKEASAGFVPCCFLLFVSHTHTSIHRVTATWHAGVLDTPG